MPDPSPHLQLLALCAVDGVPWSLIAREALKRGGDRLERLAAGEVTEISKDADRARAVLQGSVPSSEARIERAHQAIDEAASRGARLTTVLDEDYPTNLRLVHDLPPFLFYRGQLRRDDARSVAVVGTRQASERGLATARELAARLVDEGVTVLSGLARGVDTAAHEEALANGGRTLAVLGTGILRTYPAENAELAERIAESGAVVSQFWPGQSPARYTFPRRNHVTSGLSQGTVVIEASRTSGAKMQARLALEHGKAVFLVSDLVMEQEWARKYLERGAREVATAADVIKHLTSVEHIEAVAEGRRQLTLESV